MFEKRRYYAGFEKFGYCLNFLIFGFYQKIRAKFVPRFCRAFILSQHSTKSNTYF